MINNRFNVVYHLLGLVINLFYLTTDKNGRTIKVGDYVQKVNRITGSIEDSGVVTMIIGNHVYLGTGYVDGKLINLIYFSDELIVK